MGDPGRTSLSSPSAVFDTVFKHESSNRIQSEVFLGKAFKDLHPGRHVTWIKARECDLLGFASAGHAKASLINDRDNDTFKTIREYTESSSRLEEPDGSVTDEIFYAEFEYEWQDVKFPCYKLKWGEDPWVQKSNFVIVTDKANVSAEGHCRFAEALIKAAGSWTESLHDEIYVYEDGNWQKDKTLYRSVTRASWDDVILDPVMKKAIINDVGSFFSSKDTYAEYNVPWKRGMIFHGVPGCGKTISIKALMNSVQAQNVANLYVKSFKASGCQTDQASIREIFVKARAIAPALLIFEDLDSLVTDELRSFFLNEVDGVEDNNGILIIGSTNHLERLDAGISKRPSRFDRKYHYKIPAFRERLLYCQYWQTKLSKNPAVDFSDDIPHVVATLTEGFTFAYLKELFVQTLLMIVSGRQGSDDADVLNGEESSEAKEKVELPEVLIPSHLDTNHFFQVLHKQIHALVKDMASTEAEEAEKNKKKDEKSEGEVNGEVKSEETTSKKKDEE